MRAVVVAVEVAVTVTVIVDSMASSPRHLPALAAQVVAIARRKVANLAPGYGSGNKIWPPVPDRLARPSLAGRDYI